MSQKKDSCSRKFPPCLLAVVSASVNETLQGSDFSGLSVETTFSDQACMNPLSQLRGAVAVCRLALVTPQWPATSTSEF